jgi:hypothetical protein
MKKFDFIHELIYFMIVIISIGHLYNCPLSSVPFLGGAGHYNKV